MCFITPNWAIFIPKMVQKVFGGQASPEPIAAGKEVYPFLLCYFPLTTSMPCWPNSYIGSRLGAQ